MKDWNINNAPDDDFEIHFDIGQVEDYKERADTDDLNCYGHVKLGKLYAKDSRFDEALESYNQAITMNPGEAGFYFYRGIALFHLGKVNEAMLDFEHALESDPWNKCDILNFTGCIKFQSGDKDCSIEDIEKVLSRNNGLLNDLKISNEEYEELMEYRSTKD